MSGWDFDLLKEQKPNVSEAMGAIGDAGPTVRVSDKLVKGWVDGDKVYYSSDDVRIADGLMEVAKWLDCRAMSGGTET